MSLPTGLVYAYTTRSSRWGVQAWYVTAIDAATGDTAFSVRTGTGSMFNNHYSAVTLAPDGSLYVPRWPGWSGSGTARHGPLGSRQDVDGGARRQRLHQGARRRGPPVVAQPVGERLELVEHPRPHVGVVRQRGEVPTTCSIRSTGWASR